MRPAHDIALAADVKICKEEKCSHCFLLNRGDLFRIQISPFNLIYFFVGCSYYEGWS